MQRHSDQIQCGASSGLSKKNKKTKKPLQIQFRDNWKILNMNQIMDEIRESLLIFLGMITIIQKNVLIFRKLLIKQFEMSLYLLKKSTQIYIHISTCTCIYTYTDILCTHTHTHTYSQNKHSRELTIYCFFHCSIILKFFIVRGKNIPLLQVTVWFREFVL